MGIVVVAGLESAYPDEFQRARSRSACSVQCALSAIWAAWYMRYVQYVQSIERLRMRDRRHEKRRDRNAIGNDEHG